ncbi:hypothetical protein LDENG_00010190 [Lucifuga dentata]|nr:hypothetical protein LDENG_00010190 [Lucifuga dentata]
MRTKHGRVLHNARRAFLFKTPRSPLFTLFAFYTAVLSLTLLLFLAFSCFFLLFLLHSLSLASCSGTAHVPLYTTWRLLFSCLLSSPLLKQRLAVLYFKVTSSNFISCSKKFVPESARDVITTST